MEDSLIESLPIGETIEVEKGILLERRSFIKTVTFVLGTISLPFVSKAKSAEFQNEKLSYEQFLQDAEALIMRLARKQPTANVPAALHGKAEAIVLFNNLSTIAATTFQCPTDEEEKATLALELDQAMRERAPAGWKGDETREKQVLNALFPLL